MRFRILNMVIISILFIYLHSCAKQSKKEELPPPNIVWLIAQDLSPDLGCYGETLVTTPNIDNLANQGIRFTNAFSSSPLPSSSMSAFMTGVHQVTLGADDHRIMLKNRPDLPNGVKVIVDHLMDAGYFISYGGKKDYNFNFNDHKQQYVDRPLSACKPNQPFFAVRQTFHAHRPFQIEAENPIDPSQVKIPPYYPDQPLTRKDWANYLEDVNRMDEWVGQQMNYLREHNLLENTIVVFMSDNGRAMVRDKQFLYDGGTRVPLVIYCPEKFKPQVNSDLVSLVDLPKTMYKLANIEEPETLQGIDIFSQKNDYIYCARGRSGEAKDNMRSVRDKNYLFIKNERPDIAWMQNSTYKTLRYPVYTLMHVLHERGELNELQSKLMSKTKPEFELYDIKDDPHQIHNLADSLTRQTSKMHNLLLAWKEKVGDTILDPDRFYMDEKIAQKNKWASDWYKRNNLPENTSKDHLLEYWLKEYNVELK